jgi:hypothetical protein
VADDDRGPAAMKGATARASAFTDETTDADDGSQRWRLRRRKE